MVLILLVIGIAGFLQGVAVGLVVAVVLFVVNYSQTDVVRHALDGRSFASNVQRPPGDRELLRAAGQRVQVLELQGFIFFGTAKTVLDRIAGRVRDPDQPAVDALILDFRRVTGLDSSAVMSFTKVLKLADGVGFDLVLTGIPAEMGERLAREGLAEGRHPHLKVMVDLDHGMQWCEDELLRKETGRPRSAHVDLDVWFGDLVGDGRSRQRVLKYLTQINIRPGRRLIRQGSAATEMYFVLSGRLRVEVQRDEHGPRRLRVVGPGAVVGELPMYLNIERTASVVAETRGSVYRLTREDFRRMERRDPQIAAGLHRVLARLLAERLVDSQQTASALLD